MNCQQNNSSIVLDSSRESEIVKDNRLWTGDSVEGIPLDGLDAVGAREPCTPGVELDTAAPNLASLVTRCSAALSR
jgi:hypothetical protein